MLLIASLLCNAIGDDVAADIVAFGSGVNSFNMEFVPIGNPGNPADITGSPSPAGAVTYNYNMGKFEVSRDMVTKANAAGGLGLTLANMAAYNGNGLNRPGTGVTWLEAARFVNWLNTSKGFQPAYKFTTNNVTEGNSLWQPSDPGYNASNRYRNTGAHYFLPSADEWYKAAYYNPVFGNYWDFPTGSNSDPYPVASGTSNGNAVYWQPSGGPADVQLAGGLSAYKTMGMGGNVYEWLETEEDLSNNLSKTNRLLRGGAWFQTSSNGLSSSYLTSNHYGSQDVTVGFRVASVAIPESSSVLFGGVVTLGLCCWIKLKRCL